MDAVEEIKSRLNIEDVVSEYVQLKRSGRNYKGLSPFTSEKSPSFVVSPEKQIWHDFSSGRGGDMFSFVMAVEGLDFKGSLEVLARKSGVDLDMFKTQKSSSAPEKRNKERLYEAVEQAVKFYQFHLTKHTEALQYLRTKREYTKQTLIDFRFGYSPSNGRALISHLEGKGFSSDELRKAGLVSVRGSDVFDMFRGRIMIPLSDAEGRPVGFTARQLKDETNSPKYINTPSTILYDKSRQVFGLAQAKEAIRKSGYVVVVEGNLDVVASHQAGIRNVVASAGTALTSFHLKDLKRFSGDIRLAFDEDRAGQEAAARAIPLAQSLGGIDLSIISVPEGKDPDELIKRDPKLWGKTVTQPIYMVDWLIERITTSIDITSAQGKRSLIEQIVGIIRHLKDSVEREHYSRKLAEMTNTSLATIQEKIAEEPLKAKKLKTVKTSPEQEAKLTKEHRIREQHLLALCMRHQSIGTILSNVPDDVFSEDAQDTARFITQHPGVSPTGSEYGTMLSLLYEEFYQHSDEDELTYQAKHLVSRLIHTYAKTKKSSLALEMEQADAANQKPLLKAIKQLDDLVAQFNAR